MARPKKWRGKGRATRQAEAAARQAERAHRTPAQQIARLDAKGWKASRERARLRPSP